MYLIDSHCHLYAKNFEGDIEEVIQQSINNNVKKILLPNISSQTTQYNLVHQQRDLRNSSREKIISCRNNRANIFFDQLMLLLFQIPNLTQKL